MHQALNETFREGDFRLRKEHSSRKLADHRQNIALNFSESKRPVEIRLPSRRLAVGGFYSDSLRYDGRWEVQPLSSTQSTGVQRSPAEHVERHGNGDGTN